MIVLIVLENIEDGKVSRKNRKFLKLIKTELAEQRELEIGLTERDKYCGQQSRDQSEERIELQSVSQKAETQPRRSKRLKKV